MQPASSPPVATRFRRRAVLRGATALAAAALGMLALPGCRERPALRVAMQPWVGYQFMRFALDQGWEPAGQVNLVATESDAESVALLTSGQVDGAALTLADALAASARVPLDIVLVYDDSAGADMVLARPGLDSPRALRGKRIGRQDTALGKLMLHKLLDAGGLGSDEVQAITFSGTAMDAWRDDALDAIVTWEPHATQLERLGLQRIFDSSQLPQLISDVLVIRSEIARGHNETVHQLVRAHFRALGAWRENRVNVEYRIAPLLGIEVTELRALLRGLDLPDATQNREMLSPRAGDIRRAAREVAAIVLDHAQQNASRLTLNPVYATPSD